MKKLRIPGILVRRIRNLYRRSPYPGEWWGSGSPWRSSPTMLQAHFAGRTVRTVHILYSDQESDRPGREGYGLLQCREAYDRIFSPVDPFDPITSFATFSLYKRYDPGATIVKINTTVRLIIFF